MFGTGGQDVWYRWTGCLVRVDRMFGTGGQDVWYRWTGCLVQVDRMFGTGGQDVCTGGQDNWLPVVSLEYLPFKKK